MSTTEADPDSGDPHDLVEAAGCVLWRRGADGGVEVGLIHRPKYDDWSHPKGKLDDGETPREAALREVLEETGMTCVLGAPLSTTRYVAKGRPKAVHYWVAEATGGCFQPNGEVDRLLWLPPPDARAILTHPADGPLLDEALRAIGSAGSAGSGETGVNAVAPPPPSEP
ncbi:NUDIX hydrolase [Streptomyces sp. 6N223]|uniref:NUDIX hydrolase n=1 Tax=Streptomyces sp. 6N223 TaxID=3457412 RepID=UPI003FCFED53